MLFNPVKTENAVWNRVQMVVSCNSAGADGENEEKFIERAETVSQVEE